MIKLSLYIKFPRHQPHSGREQASFWNALKPNVLQTFFSNFFISWKTKKIIIFIRYLRVREEVVFRGNWPGKLKVSSRCLNTAISDLPGHMCGKLSSDSVMNFTSVLSHSASWGWIPWDQYPKDLEGNREKKRTILVSYTKKFWGW